MQDIYSPEEMRARLNFTMFFNEHFVVKGKASRHFKYPLTVEFIHNLYKEFSQDERLSLADLDFYFTITGAKWSADEILLDLRATEATQIPPQLLHRLEPHLSLETLRAINAIKKTALVYDRNLSMTYKFVDLFTKKSSKQERTAVSQLRCLYSLYCKQNAVDPLGVKAFTQLLKNTLGPIKKGYIDGRSGYSYVICTIPPNDLWELSLRYGVGIFESYGKLFDNKGRSLIFDSEQMPNAATLSHLQFRVGGKRPDGTDESATAPACGEDTEEDQEFGSTEEAKVSYSVDLGQEPYDGTADSIIAVRAEVGTISDNQLTIQLIADDRIQYEHTGGDGDAGDDDLAADDSGPIEEISLNEVFAALAIAYKINPKTFTKREMNSYLVSMDVNYSAEDLWDKFMAYVGVSNGIR